MAREADVCFNPHDTPRGLAHLLFFCPKPYLSSGFTALLATALLALAAAPAAATGLFISDSTYSPMTGNVKQAHCCGIAAVVGTAQKGRCSVRVRLLNNRLLQKQNAATGNATKTNRTFPLYCSIGSVSSLCFFCLASAYSEVLLEGLIVLNNRGCVSAGLATMSTNPGSYIVSVTFLMCLFCVCAFASVSTDCRVCLHCCSHLTVTA